MNRGSFLKYGILLCLLLSSFPARADIVYPARLQLTETAPGVFEVVFILPVIQGKVLRAQPVFPEFCTPVTEPAIEADAFQKKTFWRIQCENTVLNGQQIGIEGLLGSPIDIILEVKTLQGRTYKATLSPNEAYYLIPPPPGPSEFLQAGTLKGARNSFLQWGMALMLLAGLLMSRPIRFISMLLVLIFGACLGAFLTSQELLLIPSWTSVVAALLVSLALLLPAVMKRGTPPSRGASLSLMGIGAVLTGAGLPAEDIINGYTPGEIATLNAFTLLGISLGILLMALLVRQVLQVLSLRWEAYGVPLATGLAGLSLGVLLWELSLFWNFPTMFPPIPSVLLIFTFGMAAWSSHEQMANRQRIFLWVGFSFFLGFLGRTWDIVIPYTRELALFCSTVFLILMVLKKDLPRWTQVTVLVVGGLSAGNHLLDFADASLSYPIARSLFMGFLLALLALLFFVASSQIKPSGMGPRYTTFSSSLLLLFAFLLGGSLFLGTYRSAFDFGLSEGNLPLPFLSLGLLLGAIALWPRHRKIHRQMGLERKVPVFSLTLLAAAFFFIPVYSEIKNPFYTAAELDSEALQKLMEKKLWNTYTAFNIADEEVLFEQLAENLDEDLLDHIYLDSRRRLTMGLREGSEVTVKEVALDPLGTPEPQSAATDTWKYPATWTVTAQVKHLKHIHYRKNQYTGTIALKPMENGWKISEIILTSEDRQVIASSSL